jgi:hypothetical protein
LGSVRVKRVQLGLPTPQPKTRPWTREEEKLLGTERDVVIARRLGRHKSVIHQRRKQLGIPRFFIGGATRPWTKADDRLLGTAPDAELAKRFRRSKAAVKARRNALRIRVSGAAVAASAL